MTTTFNVLAYAPGKADDPSTARRISLSRAMAVRSALVADGVPSARIFVRALGEQYGDGPPDRVDISVTGANAPIQHGDRTMTRPSGYLIRMLVFLVAVGIVAGAAVARADHRVQQQSRC